MQDWHSICVYSPEALGWQSCVFWCKNQFGNSRHTWHYNGEGVFTFENIADLILFKLHWG